MKIKDGFVLRKLPGMPFVMPTGKNGKTFHSLTEAGVAEA